MKRDAEGKIIGLEPDEMAEIRKVVLEEAKVLVENSAEVRVLRSDNARMSRAISAYRRVERELSPSMVVSIFAVLGAGWPMALVGYVGSYGWDGAAAALSLMTLIWSVLLSVFVVKAGGK